jgi:hypothetical protein
MSFPASELHLPALHLSSFHLKEVCLLPAPGTGRNGQHLYVALRFSFRRMAITSAFWPHYFC